MRNRSQADAESQNGFVGRLAEEFLERYRSGERPAVSEYIERYPACADDIRDLFPALVLMEQVSPSDHARGDKHPQPDVAPHQLGDFRIIREVGRGGMGVVYEAEQISLGRRVALKVLPQQLLAGEKQRKRFEREAKAAARLHHTNIVPVFGVGEQQGLHYYVMQFIHGRGLDEVIRELKVMRAASEAGKVTPEVRAERGALNRDQATPSPREDVSAVQVARGLLTGQFERTLLVAERSDAGERPGKYVPDNSPHAGSVVEHDGSEVADSDLSMPESIRDTAVGRLSDTVPGSDGFVLPGQTAADPQLSSRRVYWASVARIGVQAAEALQYAHDQGIVHRDIKPANLLLDTSGVLWVTDFGLAKAADQQDLTHTGDVLGTLRYMAPEQFDGQADARSDVYALGLTLYELLALRPAFDEAERHRLIQQVTGGTPHRLRLIDAQIPRDLETIVHKAIDRVPSHRYQTAQDLADDLERFLGDEPIKAKWVSPLTRVRRWGKRNPMGAVVTLLLTLLAIGGPIVAANQIRLRNSALAAADEADQQRSEALNQSQLALANEQEANAQRARAEANLRKAREAVDRLFTRAAEDLSGEPHMEQIRRELLEDALEFYQGFMQQKSDDPVIRLETAYAYDRVGTIHQLLGDTVRELANRRQHHRLLEKLRDDYPADPQYRELLARSHVAIEHTLKQRGSVEEALEHGRQALVEWQSLAKDFPTRPSYRREIIARHVGTSFSDRTYWGTVPDEEHEARLHKALRMLDRFEADFPGWAPPKFLRFLANKRLADLMVRQGRFGEARVLHKAAWAVRGKEPPAFSSGYQVTIVHDLEAAEGQLRNKIAQFEQACADFPDVAGNAGELAKNYSYLARLLTAQDRFEEAEVFLRQSRELHQSWLERFPRDLQQRVGAAWSSYNLGLVLQVNGKLHEASAMFRVAFRLLGELADEFPDVRRHQNHYAFVLATCPAIQFRDPNLSARYAKRALQLAPQNADDWCLLGIAQYGNGDYADAITSIERGRELRERSIGSGLILAMAWWQLGDVRKGVELYQQAVKDAVDAPLLQTTSIDYRVLRAEADQLFAPAEDSASPKAAPDEQPGVESREEVPVPEQASPANHPESEDMPN